MAGIDRKKSAFDYSQLFSGALKSRRRSGLNPVVEPRTNHAHKRFVQNRKDNRFHVIGSEQLPCIRGDIPTSTSLGTSTRLACSTPLGRQLATGQNCAWGATVRPNQASVQQGIVQAVDDGSLRACHHWRLLPPCVSSQKSVETMNLDARLKELHVFFSFHRNKTDQQ